jgi:hypothetical protein
MIPPHPVEQTAGTSRLAAKVDTRTPITTWELLVWAYKRQMVHYEPETADGPVMASGAPGLASLALLGLASGDGRWSVSAAGTTAHEDAHLVHSRVCLLAPADRDLIIGTAACGQPPVWDPDIPPYRVVPVRRGGTGGIRMIYGKSHRPIACMIDYEGVPDAEAVAIREAARATYAHWWRLLRRVRLSLTLSAIPLARWRLAEIGVAREPWCSSLDDISAAFACA